MATLTTKTAIKVLLVDDDEDDAIITQALLGQTPGPHFELDWAHSYDAGLTWIQEKQYDVGLLDHNLGSRTGIEFLHETHPTCPNIPMIMLTGHGNEELVLQALQAGASDYLPKQHISSENLQRAISHAIEKIRLQVELAAHQQQLEKTNRELQQRTEEVQRFYHLLAHELKTPLTAASEFANILLEGISGPLNTEQTHFLERIQGCCGHLDRNINDLYDITRLETGKLSLQQEPGDLVPLVGEVLDYLAPKAQAKHITLQSSLDADLPHVIMDVQRIRQVLLNLVGNALKFTEQYGSVLVLASQDPLCSGRVRISIQDTGMGIPQAKLAGIFERLYQVEKDPSAFFPGLGLGLFICRELIKLHEGTMSVSSTVGQGSTFSFTIRCSRPKPRSA